MRGETDEGDAFSRASPPRDATRGAFFSRAALYPQYYVWYVFLSALDVLLTWVILHLDGREANVLADWIIRRHNLPGVVAFKFTLVVAVVLVCEFVGRRNRRAGRKLARWMIVLSAFPVVVGTVQLLRLVAEGGPR